ncbi:MAG: fumarylacetoacetate hydrolase family protein [Armatimonadota bacterium]
MRLVRFQVNDEVSYGLLEDKKVSAIEGLPWEGIVVTGDEYALSEVRLLAPVEPPNVFAIGKNYSEHATELGGGVPERPVIFLKATTSVIGPDEEIVLPAMDPDCVDIEAELAVVIGRPCQRVSEEEALDYVLGYTCGNDVSARDVQFNQDIQWARAKSFDTFCPLGPWIEMEVDPDNLAIRSRINGRVLQESNTDMMIFSCANLVSYCSQIATLLPGTVIMTGTPSGVGFARKPPVFLAPGDTVEIEIEGIGTLTNGVTDRED